MTVLEVIQRSSDFLARKGVESPRLQVELLLSHVLQMPRLNLYLNFERVLSEPELESLRKFIKRRSEREPTQHITGSTSFCGYEITVDSSVLVPRPETELLAECAWKFLADALAPQVLDFGTGSGCIAIALALKCRGAAIHGLDISEAALLLARQNAARHQVLDRIQFHRGDGFSALSSPLQFDLIVANPPYIPTAEIEVLEPEVRDFDPRLALDGGADGLAFYRRLAGEAPAHLAEGGTIMMEFGDGQESVIKELFHAGPWEVEETTKDLSGRPRFLIARKAKS